MTELEKIQYTKSFIDKLANGINPLNGEVIPENELLNNERISRCMHYVSSILETVYIRMNDVELNTTAPKVNKSSYNITVQEGEQFAYEEEMSLGEIARRLNRLANLRATRRITKRMIAKWLVNEGLAYNDFDINPNRGFKRITQEGRKLGFDDEVLEGTRGKYAVIICNNEAQRYIVEHANIIAEKYDIMAGKPELSGRAWDDAQEGRLIEMFDAGMRIVDIAKELKRTPTAIRSRLKRLNLIEV